jgi:hypothetical protein
MQGFGLYLQGQMSVVAVLKGKLYQEGSIVQAIVDELWGSLWSSYKVVTYNYICNTVFYLTLFYTNPRLYFSHSMLLTSAVPFPRFVSAAPYLIKYQSDTSCTNKESSRVKGGYQPYRPVQYYMQYYYMHAPLAIGPLCRSSSAIEGFLFVAISNL